MKIEESLNVTFDETLSPSKTSPFVDDDLDEEEGIKVTEKKNLENDIQDEALEINEVVNVKESRNHPLENVIGNINQRTLRLEDSKPIKTPMSLDTKLTKDEECKSVDSTKYRDMIGTMHLELWYPKGTIIETVVYADSDHARDYVDRKSTRGICTFVGCCLTSWFSKKQTALAISMTEFEYISVEKACEQALWMKQALIDYDIRFDDVPIMCDNKGAIEINKNPMQHSQTKHIELRHHFVRDNCTLPTQGMGSIISMVFISPEGFMPFILLLVVVIVTVVIVAVILVVVVVAIDGVVIVVMIIGVEVVVTIIRVVVVGQGILGESNSSNFHFAVLGTVTTRKYRFSSFKPTNKINSSFRTIEVEMLATHKLLESSIGDTEDGGKAVGRAIIVSSKGICNSLLVASYAGMTFMYGLSCKGEKASEAKRSLVKLSEMLGEMFLGGMRSIISMVSISPEGFLSSIWLLGVVIVAVILVVVVVAVDGVVIVVMIIWIEMALNNAQTKTNSLAFRSMLEKHQLTGPNFNEWFRALKLVVRTEKLRVLFEIALPPAPAAGADALALADWAVLFYRHNEVACLILGTMSPKLYQHVSKKGACYFITFTDDYSHYGYVYLLKHIHEVFETFKDFILQKESGRIVELEDEEILPFENTSEHPIEEESLALIISQEEDVILVRRSIRTHKAPDRLCLNVEIYPIRLCFNVEVEEHSLGDLNEPANYKVALSNPEFQKWLVAMNAKMQSMYDNKVWRLVVLPPNAKVVKSKWIYKKKMDMDGKVHIYKAQLVAKGCTQTYETKRMHNVSYASAVGSIMYASYELTAIAMLDSKPTEMTKNLKLAAKEAVWIRKFIDELGVVPSNDYLIKMNCDNSAAIIMAKESGIQKGARHFKRKYHYVCECIETDEIDIVKVHIDDNLADSFTKALAGPKLTRHARSLVLRPASSFM
nr:retrovirus-related Pol polyprotein from transposon TNT 1-94 [Tanacetum cinerariifolium]